MRTEGWKRSRESSHMEIDRERKIRYKIDKAMDKGMPMDRKWITGKESKETKKNNIK